MNGSERMPEHAEKDAPARSRCVGVDCPGCTAGRIHYRDTGCLISDCPGGHGRVPPPGSDAAP